MASQEGRKHYRYHMFGIVVLAHYATSERILLLGIDSLSAPSLATLYGGGTWRYIYISLVSSQGTGNQPLARAVTTTIMAALACTAVYNVNLSSVCVAR